MGKYYVFIFSCDFFLRHSWDFCYQVNGQVDIPGPSQGMKKKKTYHDQADIAKIKVKHHFLGFDVDGDSTIMYCVPCRETYGKSSKLTKFYAGIVDGSDWSDTIRSHTRRSGNTLSIMTLYVAMKRVGQN